MNFQSRDDGILLARVSDYCRNSQKGELSVSAFLSPSEIAVVKNFLISEKCAHRAVFLGGYDESERRVLFLLPAYTDDFDGGAAEKLNVYFSDEVGDAICALRICGSKYRELSHRDYLGSLLSLGIQRDVLGDIVLLDAYGAVVFCSGKISEFIKRELERVANDAVSISDFVPDDDFAPQREFKRINTTVASPRMDCVVSALTGLSREKAQELIKKELCQLDHTTETRCDAPLVSENILSVRGYGKYKILEIDERTKKGRIRLSADKYI